MKILTEQEKKLIIDSGLFDAEWYLEKYQDVQKVGIPLPRCRKTSGIHGHYQKARGISL